MLSDESHDAVGEEAAPGGGLVNRDPEEEVLDWNVSMENYAKMLYSANALRDRTGTVTGKLRFDISPGSTIIISADNARAHAANVDVFPTSMVGFVARVTTTINSENASAATTYEMTHLRTLEEDLTTKDGRISMESHPFFEDTFKLAPLVEDLDI